MTKLRQNRRPLAVQLRDRLWANIQAGDFRPGGKLPSEHKLALRFGVSRTTVREALKILQEERVVLCRHGVGHFLLPEPSGVLSDDITHLKSVTELTLGLGITISARVVSLREGKAEEPIVTKLGLDPGSTIAVLERIRLARGEPIIYSIDMFPRRLVVGELRAEDLTGSLISVMEGSWGLRMEYSKAVLSAVMLDPEVAKRTGLPGNIPWILMEQTNYDPQDKPFLCSRDYHRGDKFQFHVLRRRR